MIMMNKQHQYERVFDHFDENKDGKISPSELQQCVRAIGGELSQAEAEAAVKYSDSDGDGMLCFDEFVRLVDGGEEEEKVKDLKEAFRMYQLEGSEGIITPYSLNMMLTRLGLPSTIEKCRIMISKFDLNADGVLNFDEFKVMML
ncbi:calcium-binding protein CML38-like [Euphorbia lathyris]|uniref:calcium-binding protein CML38-like n=1 Tax=Euphorbia lathyris TaxID=212925 RepID=UPI0033139EEC